MATGRTNAGGGGSSLNFKVIVVASELLLPATAKENTIAVITDTAITSYVFSVSAPTSPAEGMVWVATGTASVVGFNALKKNNIQLYPSGCQQYISGVWTVKKAVTWQNNAWQSWEEYLYNHGDQCNELTGGWASFSRTDKNVVSFEADHIFMSAAYVASNYGATVCSANKIDVTNKSLLRLVASSERVSSGVTDIPQARFGLVSAKQYKAPTDPSSWTASVALVHSQDFNTTKVYKTYYLDISSVSGSYYVAASNFLYGDYSKGGTRMWITEIAIG